MEKNFKMYEQNEFSIADTLTRLYPVKDIKINPTINPFERIDLFFTNQKDIKYACEIKCRNKLSLGMMIEQTKLIELVKYWKLGNNCKYINYIESNDQLIIYDLNSRFERLDLKDIADDPFNSNLYSSIISKAATAEDRGESVKLIKLLYFDPNGTNDFVITNYSNTLAKEGIKFNYNGKIINEDFI